MKYHYELSTKPTSGSSEAERKFLRNAFAANLPEITRELDTVMTATHIHMDHFKLEITVLRGE